jgi:hypothetical protein
MPSYTYQDAISWIYNCCKVASIESWSPEHFKKETYYAITSMRKSKCPKDQIDKAKEHRKKKIEYYINKT